MNENKITEYNICILINNFYKKIRIDHQLSPIFLQVIGNSDKIWQQHLKIMNDFWSSLMLATKRYHGNPYLKHLMLPKFDKKLFDRWLKLFEETAREVYSEELAMLFVKKSTTIAQGLQYGLYHPSKGRYFNKKEEIIS